MGETEIIGPTPSVDELASEQPNKQVQRHKNYYCEILLLDLLRSNEITQEEYNTMMQQERSRENIH